MIPYIFSHLFIHSEMTLEQTADVLSKKLFGGVAFGGKDEFIRDEVPAIYTDAVLGLRIVIHGYGGEDGFVLEINTRNYPWDRYPGKKQTDLEVNISEYIAWLLRDAKELRTS